MSLDINPSICLADRSQIFTEMSAPADDYTSSIFRLGEGSQKFIGVKRFTNIDKAVVRRGRAPRADPVGRATGVLRGRVPKAGPRERRRSTEIMEPLGIRVR